MAEKNVLSTTALGGRGGAKTGVMSLFSRGGRDPPPLSRPLFPREPEGVVRGLCAGWNNKTRQQGSASRRRVPDPVYPNQYRDKVGRNRANQGLLQPSKNKWLLAPLYVTSLFGSRQIRDLIVPWFYLKRPTDLQIPLRKVNHHQVEQSTCFDT